MDFSIRKFVRNRPCFGTCTAHATLEARGAKFINAPHLNHRHPNGTEGWLAMLEDPRWPPAGDLVAAEGVNV